MEKIIKIKSEYIKDHYQNEQSHLITLGMQFYVAGRICYVRNLMHLFLIVPLLFRHAIEYFIKGHLSYDMSMKEIKKKYSHDLDRLWKKIKEIEKDEKLNKYDNFIEQFNKTEGIRYPKGEQLKPGEKDAFEIDVAFNFEETPCDTQNSDINWNIGIIDEIIYEICRRMRSPTPPKEWIELKYNKCNELFHGNKFFKKDN